MEKIPINGKLQYSAPIPGNNNNSQNLSNTKRTGQKAGDFWRIYFYLQYLLCICPFRFAKVNLQQSRNNLGGRSHLYTTKSWLPQKLVCFVIDVLSLFGIFGELRLSLPKDTSNPTLYFEMAQTMAFSCGKLLILKRYWFDEEKILKLLNLVMSSELGTMSNAPLRRKIIGSRYTFMILCIGYFMNEIATYTSSLDSGDVSTGKITVWQNMVSDAKYNFLFKKTNLTSRATVELGNGIGGFLLGFLACLNYFQRNVLGAFDNMFVLSAIVTLWTMTTSFIQILEEEHGLKMSDRPLPDFMRVAGIGNPHHTGAVSKTCPWWPMFFERYQHIRRVAEDTNQLFGINITMILVETIVFFAVAFESLFSQLSGTGKSNWFASFVTCVVLFVICLSCILSADIDHKLYRVREWLALPENRNRIPPNELQYVLDDLEYSGVSIKASNTYPITYNLLANVAGTSVTYFIICVQI